MHLVFLWKCYMISSMLKHPQFKTSPLLLCFEAPSGQFKGRRTAYTNNTLWLHSSRQVSRIYNLHLNRSYSYSKKSVPVAISFGFLHLWLSFGRTNCSDPFGGKLILLTSCLASELMTKKLPRNQKKNLISTVVAHIQQKNPKACNTLKRNCAQEISSISLTLSWMCSTYLRIIMYPCMLISPPTRTFLNVIRKKYQHRKLWFYNILILNFSKFSNWTGVATLLNSSEGVS